MASLTITKSFVIEVAHFFSHQPEGNPNRRVHGHSYYIDVTLKGDADPDTGMIHHFDELGPILEATKAKLDHRLLNDIPGLAAPSMEHIAIWVANDLRAQLPQLHQVRVRRPSAMEEACYTV